MQTGLDLQSVRDIKIFLNFVNFYIKFIRNFSRIVVQLILILQTTGNSNQSTQTYRNKKNQDTKSRVSRVDVGVDADIKNLSIVIKLVKLKKLIWLSLKSRICQKSIFPKQIFLLSKPKKLSYIYKISLLKHQFFSILIQNAIFVSRLMLQDMPPIKIQVR